MEPHEADAPALSDDDRLAGDAAVAAALTPLDDDRLTELVAGAPSLGAGIGGTSALLEVAGRRVFVKSVPLTDLERRAGNIGSTANLFGMPTFCQYGIGDIGSPGAGAWRELAAHTMTSDWVRTGEARCFPLLHHWRVLTGLPNPVPDEFADVDAAVRYWGGSPAVRDRVEAIVGATAHLMLFAEYIPERLDRWLADRLRAGGEAAAAAVTMVERELLAGVAAMNRRGLIHFDAHFANILTDGRRLYLTDFGLANADRFDLSAAEAEFCHRHRDYDRYYAAKHLVHWLLAELTGYDAARRDALIRRWAAGEEPADPAFPAAVVAVFRRHAPVAAVLSDFHTRFRSDPHTTPYPVEELRRVDHPSEVSGS